MFKSRTYVLNGQQFHGGAESAAELIRWFRKNDGSAQWIDSSPRQLETLGVRTPSGIMHARPGDWIVMRIVGEFYVFKPEPFHAMFSTGE
jgi:hypothetical protein